jgi:hypothetical protein
MHPSTALSRLYALIRQGITISKKITKMKILHHIQSENFSNIFLYGAFMFANIDYIGIVDYAIKAILGAAIWYGFKFLQDYYSARARHKIFQQIREQENKTDKKQ